MGFHEKCIQFWLENLQGRHYLQNARLEDGWDDNINGNINKLRERVCVWNGLIGSRERQALGSCEHGSHFTRGDSLDKLGNY
jgi:hypothetical protein